MADDRQGREEQEDNEERRQRDRDLQQALDRADEPAPGKQLRDLHEALETEEYPVTTEELIEDYGDYEVETQGGRKSIDEVLTPVDDETYASADDVRNRLQRVINRR